VSYLGRVKPDEVDQLLADVRLVVLPSLWLEGCPTVVAEAFRAGKPVIACDNPNLRSLIGEAGWTTSPTVTGLRDTLDSAYGDVAACREKGKVARTTYETTMTAGASLELLREAYATALRTRSSVDPRH
jgi:glycosyltransferase involved in cell wall biosynthesis